MKEPPFPLMAQGKVRFVGDIVAFVVAETLEEARAAAELVAVDYEALPAVVGVLDAVRTGAPQLFDEAPGNLCCDWALGDEAATDAAFAKAAHVAKLSLTNNRLIGNPMEPRAAVAEYDPGKGHYTLHTTSQFPHVVRWLMSALVLKMPEQKVRVVAPDVGGGFGVKQFHYGEEAIITWAAKKIGAPIKWVSERSEGFVSDRHGRDHVTEAELALDENGKFLGFRVHTLRQYGRLSLHLRAQHPHQPLCAAAERRLHDAGDLLQRQGRVHQHRAGRRLSRRGAARRRPSWLSASSMSRRRRWASTAWSSAGAT